MNLNILNEFGEETTKDWPVGVKTVVTNQFITSNSIEPDHAWLYVGILLAIIVVPRLLSIAALAYRSSRFF